MTNPYTFEDIARYASGEMDAGEQAAFEAALQQNATLQQQLALHNEVQAALQQQFSADSQQQALQQTLQQLNQEYFTTPQANRKVISMKRMRLPVAAAAAAIIALVIWQPWQQDLYTRYAGTAMVVNVERGDNTDSLLTEATTAFNNSAFEKAAQLLQTITALQPDNSMALFYYAVSLTHTSRLKAARPVLQQVYNGTSAYKYDAVFYMALTYVQEKDKNTARAWLQKIPSDAAIYAKAKELLEDL